MFNDLLCMHRTHDALAALRVQGTGSGLHWCKWTCNNCTLQVSDLGRVFWSNGTYFRDLFRWSRKYNGSRHDRSCWHPSRPLWRPTASTLEMAATTHTNWPTLNAWASCLYVAAVALLLAVMQSSRMKATPSRYKMVPAVLLVLACAAALIAMKSCYYSVATGSTNFREDCI